jgi:hypothetical protein
MLFNGVNYTDRVDPGSVTVNETAGDSNATMTFTVEFQSYAAANANTSWLTQLGQIIALNDLTNGRRVFLGVLVNCRRRHLGATGVALECTAISHDSWLDRRLLPTWTSKRPNGTNMATDREQVQNLTTLVSQAKWDAINTYVASTNAAMPVVKLDNGGTARTILAAIAEAAATAADPTTRRFYIDFDNHLHYFKGSEGNSAPYIIGDASYTSTVRATSGILSLVSFREVSGNPYDPYGAATVTMNGGYTQNVASLVPNEEMMRSVTLNGTTGYASLAGATLHQGNGPWSVELWFKRGATLGTVQTMVSAGTNDYEIGFTAANEIVVSKEGTGNNFVTNATYTDTNAHHLVVVRPNGGPTVVYVDGASKAGTTTARTFVSAAGAVNIGRRLSSTDRYFTGTLQDVAFYDAALSAATALAHYNDGWTLVADEFEFETDVIDTGQTIYVKGGNAAGSGWVTISPPLTYSAGQAIIDRPQSTTASLREALAQGYGKREMAPVHSGRATITMPASTWRAGQTLTIDNHALGVPDDAAVFDIPATFEIRQLVTHPELGSGVVTYEIYFGALPWSGNFAVQRKKKL